MLKSICIKVIYMIFKNLKTCFVKPVINSIQSELLTLPKHEGSLQNTMNFSLQKEEAHIKTVLKKTQDSA